MTTESRASYSIVEALMFSLRSGTQVLARHDVLRRISEISDHQLREVATRLQKFKSEIAPAWTAQQLELLIVARKNSHNE